MRPDISMETIALIESYNNLVFETSKGFQTHEIQRDMKKIKQNIYINTQPKFEYLPFLVTLSVSVDETFSTQEQQLNQPLLTNIILCE